VRPYKFIISGGGTGGHIYPAIAIANALKQRFPDAVFLFVGAKDRMEMEKVPQAGYPIRGLWISGFQRGQWIKNLLIPFKLLSSFFTAFRLLRSFRPDVAIGTGGYASAPLLRMASLIGVPSLIQEQNGYAGVTNTLLGRQVQTICVAYDRMDRFFPAKKLVLTGNPVRRDLVGQLPERAKALDYFDLKHLTGKVLLVLGGSLGARRINEFVASRLAYFARQDLTLIWQCGPAYFEANKSLSGPGLVIVPFIQDMAMAYAAADVVISRSGALSVSELCLVGKPVIFVPSPNVAEDHQTKNAQALASKEAAIMIAETDLERTFDTVFAALFNDPQQQKALSEAIKACARPEATEAIVTEIQKLINR
jgi:UDP-N-acetylglucosamine--N-acetylmuramyl-(pentapeptide) pyrophosphoryl-undecaprenol N-acetylglucosamine transferase